jgi:Protein of unknown function
MKLLALAGLLLVGMPAAACAQHSGTKAVPAMYATKAEAEKAAKLFNCTGAHPMGDQWMPCAKHGQAVPHSAGH